MLCALWLASMQAGCGHLLEDGTYQLEAGEILRDSCGLAEAPGIFASGHLRTRGEWVRFDYALFDMQLVGFYMSAAERWRADGTVGNMEWEINGRLCPLDEIRISMEARAEAKGRFEGVFSLSTHTPQAPECVCTLWAHYAATLQGG